MGLFVLLLSFPTGVAPIHLHAGEFGLGPIETLYLILTFTNKPERLVQRF